MPKAYTSLITRILAEHTARCRVRNRDQINRRTNRDITKETDNRSRSETK